MNARGMTLIDVIVGTALVTIIFLALFGILRSSVQLSTYIKNEATANAIANSQMEYLRSLPYSSVGTVGGIPSGTIQEYSTTTEDGVGYEVRTFIDYYDDPADGIGVNDTNGITTDYKKMKVTVYYSGANGSTKQITLVSNYAPPSIETTTGGGTLLITVVNANGSPVPGASVTITDNSTSPTVNLTTFSDANGDVELPGAATSTQYDVSVTKAGYSTAQTYAYTVTNQNPNPGYLTVVASQTTSQTFAIDVLGTLDLSTYSPIATSSFIDNFADSSKLASQNGTVAGGGSLTLAAGSSSGTAISTTTTPNYLYSWGIASSTMSIPSGTTAIFQVVDQNGNLLPDTSLPGNSTGFTGPVNLAGVSTTTYPALALMATLTSSASTSVPYLSGWSLTYQVGPIPLPNVGFTLTGAKTIGTTGLGAPIYKTTVSNTTGSTGTDSISLEWDSYSLTVPNYDIEDACGVPPYGLSPGATDNESLILTPTTGNSLLVNVTDGSGNVVPGATVQLSNGGFSETATASSCGNAYFGNLSASDNYSVTISDTGYTTTSANNVSVSGETIYGLAF